MKTEIDIPQNVNVKIEKGNVTVSSGDINLSRKFAYPGVTIESTDGKITLSSKTDNKTMKRMINTFRSHIRNMVIGAQKEYVYELKIVFKHFPITLEQQGSKILIKNFLGERKDRVAKIVEDVRVEVKGSDIFVSGHDKEKVSQTAANIEVACRVKGLDRRIIQDGIFITKKDRGELVAQA